MIEIELPDGSIAEFPDGMSDEQIAGVLREQFGGAQTEQPSLPGRIGRGIVRGLRDPVDAGAQMLVRGASAIGLAPESEVARVDQINRDAESAYQASRGASAGTFDPSRIGGQMLGTAPMFAAAPVGTTLGARTAIGAATGGGFGALNPVTEPGDDFWQQKGEQVKSGAIAGAIAAPVAGAIARVVRPKTSPDVQKLMREGVTPTPGQVLGGGWRTAEEKAKSLPILGSSIRNAEQRSAEQLNRAAVNRALFPIGKQVPKGAAGREAIEFAENALKQSYDDVLTKVGAPRVDNQMMSELANLRSIIANQPKDFAGRLDRIIDNEILGRTQHGRLTGEAIKAAESNLGSLARGLRRNADYDTRKLGEAVDETQRILRTWLERAAPKDVTKQLRATNQGWANFKRVQRAAASVAAEDGVFSAAQLHSAVRALDRSKDKAAFARGSAPMQDLSSAAKNVLSNRVPNSGTADRALAALGILGPAAGATVSPWLAAGALPAIAYTRPGQAAMAGLLASRPALAEPVAQGVRALGAPVLTGSLFGLLSR